MSYFLTNDDIKAGRKCLLGGRIVTPIRLAGRKVMLAEDGQWHHYTQLQPLTEHQIREEVIAAMASLIEGKQISTLKAKGKGVEFVLGDNTRVGLTITSGENLELRVTDSDGQRIL